MTQEQKDAAWRLLPEGFKRQLRCDYTTAESAHSLDPTNVRIEAHKKFLEMYFGKHNLTATEEKKPRFSKGDRMRYIGEYQEFANKIWIIDGEVFYNDYHKCDMVSSLINGSAHLCNVPLSDLEPYTEEQEPKIGECVDSSSSLQNEISSLSKEDAEELAKCLAEVNNFIERDQASQVDWLAYRMELVKDTLRYITSCSTPQEMKANELADYVMTTVDGIVERLKGGEK